MIAYAPFVAVLFWGTMIAFGIRSAVMQDKGPLAKPLKSIGTKFGNMLWIPIVVLLLAVVGLVSLDSKAIRERRSPVGVFTTLAFLPLLAADALIVAKLCAGETPTADE